MFPQIFNLLTTAPGNLVYHLVLAFSIVAALQAVILQYRPESRSGDRRLILALLIVLICQVALFLSSGLAWQGLADPQVFLPPLDRAVTVLGLIWIAWIWIFPSASRPADAGVAILSMAVIVALLFTFAGWGLQANANALFTNSIYDYAWTGAGLAILFAATALLLVRRPNGWGIGLGFMLVNLAGFLAHLLWGPIDQNFSGLIRLAQLSTYPLIPTLARQFAGEREPASEPQTDSATPAARRMYSADPRTVKIWLDVATNTHQKRRVEMMLQAITRTMLADLGLMIAAYDSSDDAVILNGFDLIREESVSGRILPISGIPQIANTLRRERPMRLPVDHVAALDLDTVARALDLHESGQVLVIPLEIPEATWGGLLLLSPFAKRMWTLEDQSFLVSLAGPINSLIAGVCEQKPEATPPAPVEIAPAAPESQAPIASVQPKVEQPVTEPVEPGGLADSELAAMLAVQKEAQATIARLERENQKLREMVEEGVDEYAVDANAGQLEADLRLTLQEVAHLRNDLADANKKILELSEQAAQPAPNEDHEVITSLAQELRQPLSTIIGYTDLLLGESIGVLGALQQKFLERMKSSSQRMRILLDDLLQMASLHDGQLELAMQPVDLNTTLDYVLTDMRSELREKNINLRIDIPEEMPSIFADKDAVSQIITHLLHNALEVTPVEGDIHLRAEVQPENGSSPNVLLQVADTGPGVPETELPRVFTRIYRAEHPLIQGVADSGIGLAIAKTLVEAQGGQIWVESQLEVGTVFSVLLPVEPAGAGEVSAEA